MSGSKRVPPLNLTESEFRLLRDIVERGGNAPIDDPDYDSIVEKLNRISRDLRTERST